MKNTRLTSLMELQNKNPKDPFFKYAIALEYVSLNKSKSALELFEELFNLNPDFLPNYYQYAKLLERSDLDRAKNIYAKGIELALKTNDIKTMNELQAALNILEEEY